MNTGARTGVATVKVLSPEGGRDLALDQLPTTLATITEPGGPIAWVHADLEPPVVDALDKMGLDELILKSLRGGPERPRVEEFADHLYVSLLLAKTSRGGSDDSSTAGNTGEEGSLALRLTQLRLFLGPRWLITVGAIDDADYATLAGRVTRQVFSRDRGPSFIVYHICEFLVENLEPMLDGLDDRVDALEDEVIVTAGESAVQQLFSLKRDSVELRRRLAPLRDVLQRLGAHGVPYIEPEVEVYFRDAHDDIMRDLELLDTYRDILTSALDLHLSSVSNKLNQVMKQLTIVATMFLPLSFIVGLFGTNFFDMPYKNTVWFAIMFVLMFLSILAMFLYTRRRA
jgi:magnesium transporter